MFAIYRQQRGTMFMHSLHEHRPGHNQRFLVGEQHFLAGVSRSKRRTQPCRANDGRHYGIHLGKRSHALERFYTTQYFSCQTGSTNPTLQFDSCHRFAKYGIARGKFLTLGKEQVDLTVCAQGNHAVAVRVATHHIQRIHANGAGTAKDGQILK
ncbi:MAG: hypothetical protein QG672_1235 [Pseudomonadota bacterium]|nr:hypothetical protein [Pseudomonadota bacterium]